MNGLIVFVLVLPILFFQSLFFRRFIETKFYSAAYGILNLSFIFVRTAIARVSGGELPEAALLAHPDNDWLRALVTSEYSYAFLHFLFLVNAIWFFYESKKKVREWKLKEKEKIKGRFKIKLANALDGVSTMSAENGMEFNITDFGIEEIEIDTVKIKNLQIEELTVASINRQEAHNVITTDDSDNTVINVGDITPKKLDSKLKAALDEPNVSNDE